MHSPLQTARPVGPPSRVARLFLALSLIGSTVALSARMSARGAPDANEIKKLIEQLGDDKARIRQEASRKLEALGEAALAPLRAAATSHPDVDVRLRAAVLAAAIHKKLYGEVRRFTGHNGWVFRVVLARDGKQAVSVGDAIRVWEVATGNLVRSFGQGGWSLAL